MVMRVHEMKYGDVRRTSTPHPLCFFLPASAPHLPSCSWRRKVMPGQLLPRPSLPPPPPHTPPSPPSWRRKVMPGQRHRGSVLMLYMQVEGGGPGSGSTDHRSTEHTVLMLGLRIRGKRKIGVDLYIYARCGSALIIHPSSIQDYHDRLLRDMGINPRRKVWGAGRVEEVWGQGPPK